MICVAQARPDQRAVFIQKTYTHLAGAVGAFILLEFIFFQTGIAQTITALMLGSSLSWLVVLGVLGWFFNNCWFYCIRTDYL